MKIRVLHRYYGCDSGCCGHIIEVDGIDGDFEFTHPYGKDPKVWAQELVKNKFGAEHIKDLDWDNCEVIDN